MKSLIFQNIITERLSILETKKEVRAWIKSNIKKFRSINQAIIAAAEEFGMEDEIQNKNHWLWKIFKNKNVVMEENNPNDYVRLDRKTGMYCVYSKGGEKLEEFRTEAEAKKWANENFDTGVMESVDNTDRDTIVSDYIQSYFGNTLDESTSDEDIMEAFNDLLETADAVEGCLNEISDEVNELKVPKGRMPFSNVSKKQALRSFVRGLKKPNTVRRSDLAGLTSRRWNADNLQSRPGDYAQSGADLAKKGKKPSRRQKRSKFRGVARRPIAQGATHAMSLGGTALGSLDQALANRAMRKKRALMLRKRAPKAAAAAPVKQGLGARLMSRLKGG